MPPASQLRARLAAALGRDVSNRPEAGLGTPLHPNAKRSWMERASRPFQESAAVQVWFPAYPSRPVEVETERSESGHFIAPRKRPRCGPTDPGFLPSDCVEETGGFVTMKHESKSERQALVSKSRADAENPRRKWVVEPLGRPALQQVCVGVTEASHFFGSGQTVLVDTMGAVSKGHRPLSCFLEGLTREEGRTADSPAVKVIEVEADLEKQLATWTLRLEDGGTILRNGLLRAPRQNGSVKWESARLCATLKGCGTAVRFVSVE